MTCYLPPCCNLSSSPIRQSPSLFLFLFRRPAALSLSSPSSAIPRSSASSFEVHPLLLVVRLKVSRSLLRRKFLFRAFFHPLDVSSSPVFSPPPPLPSTPVLVFVHSRLLFSGVNLRSRKIVNIDRTRPRIEREKDRREDARAMSERE